MRHSTSKKAPSRSRAQGLSRIAIAIFSIGVLSACTAPIGVQKIPSFRAQQDLTRSVLSSGELSERAQTLLRRTNQGQAWKSDPAGVLAKLHEVMISEPRR